MFFLQMCDVGKESISSNGSERAPVATPVPNSESPGTCAYISYML